MRRPFSVGSRTWRRRWSTTSTSRRTCTRSSTSTVPVEPSTSTRSPSANISGAPTRPTTAGTRYSRVRIARWLSGLPVSATRPGHRRQHAGQRRVQRAHHQHPAGGSGGIVRHDGGDAPSADADRCTGAAGGHVGHDASVGGEPEPRRQRRRLGVVHGGCHAGDVEPGRGGRSTRKGGGHARLRRRAAGPASPAARRAASATTAVSSCTHRTRRRRPSRARAIWSSPSPVGMRPPRAPVATSGSAPTRGGTSANATGDVATISSSDKPSSPPARHRGERHRRPGRARHPLIEEEAGQHLVGVERRRVCVVRWRAR